MQPEAATFTWPVRVYFEDTDAAGIVYYANFLKFFERCRTEWLRALGINQVELAAREHLQFVVASMTVDYRLPARLDEELIVHARIEHLRGASLTFAQEARRAGALLATAHVRVACVDNRRWAPAPLPPVLRSLLAPESRVD